jgi:hypothetical protein
MLFEFNGCTTSITNTCSNTFSYWKKKEMLKTIKRALNQIKPR